MAEAILRHHGAEQFLAFSAGTQPAGYVHPLATQALKDLNISTEHLASENLNQYLNREFDLVITLCDEAHSRCPNWPGIGLLVHWGLPDPTLLLGSDLIRQQAALALAQKLQARIQQLVRLPIETMPRQDLAIVLRQLSQL